MSLGRGARLSALKLVNSALGAMLGFALAWVLPTNGVMDALNTAMVVAVNLARELPRVVGMVLIPFLIESSMAKRDRVPALVATWWLVFLGIATAFIYVAAPAIIRISAPNLPDEALVEGGHLLRILAPSFFLLGLFGAGQNLFYAHRVFYEPELAATVWRVVAMVALFVLGGMFGVRGYAVGLVAAAAVQLAILTVAGRRHGIAVAQVTAPFQGLGDLRPLIAGAGTVATFLLLDQANPFIDRFITSYLEPGSISILNYGDRLAKTLPVLMATSFISVFVPELSTARVTEGSMRRVGSAMAIFLISVGLPLGVLVVWSAHDVVGLILHHGKFTARQAPVAATTVIAYGVGIPASLAGMGLKGMYFVERNTREVFRFGMLALVINTLSDLALFKMGVGGIALASSVTVWIVVIYLWKRAGLGWPAWGAALRISGGTAAMIGLLFAIPWAGWFTQPATRLVLGTAVALGAYLAVVYPFWKAFETGAHAALPPGAAGRGME